MTEKISYRKPRDIGEVFGTSFKFVKQNFKALYGSLLLFSAPLLLAGTLCYTFVSGLSGFSSIFSMGLNYGISSFFGIFAVGIICALIGVSVYTVTLNKTVITNETLADEQTLSIGLIGKDFFKDYWRMLGNIIIFSLVMLFLFGFIFMLFGGLVGIIKVLSASGILMGIIIVLLVLAFFLILCPLISFVPLAALFVCQRDRMNIFAALGKVFTYLKGNFWITWVFSMLALLTYSTMAAIVQIPVLIITTVSAYSRMNSGYTQGIEQPVSITMIVITIICSLIGYAILSVFYMMNIYHFTSLEEKKNGARLLESINAIS